MADAERRERRTKAQMAADEAALREQLAAAQRP